MRRYSAIRKAAAHDGRREDGPHAARRQQPAGVVRGVAHALHHGPGDGADGDGRRHARAGRPAQQEGREHHRAPGRARLAAGGREGEVHEELARPRGREDRAIDGEQDDERGRDVHRRAEHTLQRDGEVRHQALGVVAAMRPGVGQVVAEEGVEDEDDGHHRHDPAGRAPRHLQHQRDQQPAHHDVHGLGEDDAVLQVIAARDEIPGDVEAGRDQRPVPGREAVAEAARHGEQHEPQHHGEAHMREAQGGGGDDAPGRVEVEQRHHECHAHRHHRHDAAEAVHDALLRLDQRLDAARRLGVERRLIHFGREGGCGHAGKLT